MLLTVLAFSAIAIAVIWEFFRPIYGICFIIVVGFFMSPEIYIPYYIDYHTTLFYLLLLFIVCFAHRRDFRKTKFFFVMLLYVAFCFQSTLINGVSEEKVQGGFYYHVQIFKSIALTSCLISYIQTRKEFLMVINSYIFGAFCSALFGIIQYFFGIDPPGAERLWTVNRWGGFFTDTNIQACFLAVGISLGGFLYLAASKKSYARYYYLAFLIAAFLGNLLCVSRSGIVGMFIAGSMLFLRNIKNVSIVLLIGLFGYVLFTLGGKVWEARQTVHTSLSGKKTLDESSAARLKFWGNAFELFIRNPFLGVGPGRFTEATKRELGFRQHFVVHNTPLHVLVEVGILGFIPFACVPLLSFGALSRLRKKQDMFFGEFSRYYTFGLLALLFCTQFFSMQSFPIAWMLLSLPLVLEKVMENEAAAGFQQQQ